MIRAVTTFAGPCTGAPRRDFLLGMRRGQLVGAHVPSWCSRHGWTLVAPDELARLASLQLVATRRLRRVQGGCLFTGDGRRPAEGRSSPGSPRGGNPAKYSGRPVHWSVCETSRKITSN